MQEATTPMDWFSHPDHDASIMSAWEHLIDGGEANAGELRCVVDDSWRRCLVGQVDPGAGAAPPPLDEGGLRERRERNERLVSASLPLIQQTREFLSQTGTIMLLADPDGMILQQEGDMRIVEPAGEVGLIPGCDWTELNCGTNAIGTALALQQPVQIHGAEHFCAGIKRWTCSATVIRDPLDGGVLGVIDVSGLAQTYSRHSLALTVSLAGRIESRLAKLAMERRLRLLDRCASHFGSARSDGVLVLDERGKLVKANPQAPSALTRLGVNTALNSAFSVPGLDARTTGSATRPTPAWLRLARVDVIREGGEMLGFLVVIPAAPNRLAAGAAGMPAGRPGLAPAFSRIVGNGAALRSAVEKAQHLAPSRVPVLLLGETGVGKELFAQGIHQASACSDGPFVALNCGGLSRDLLASELFGYAEGAFTGARKSGAAGKIEAANRGTLFLDEIGEMPLDIQPHLLRVLEEGEIYRLGENAPRKVSFRLVAATHRNLRDDVAAGKFRMDLFYRIAVTNIAIPPLRERKDDIPALVSHWLAQLCERYGLPMATFDDDAYRCLLAYDWPGNVRELRNALEGSLLMADGGVITVDKLPLEIGAAGGGPAADQCKRIGGELPETVCSLEVAEAESIRKALAYSSGNLTKTASRLGIAKSTLYQKIRKYGLSVALSETRGRGA
ncbi:sigma-54-dependent Fis family transcriptional regulator [Cupriavidus basilensis]|uniref:Sigma-54-dependent Fis family transcriptional regulator n=1 Tax=Cupriavidus basilensis TaxID=68895 RepID=A0ABT6ALH0_9BURK|nr:sigma-54-dependent Fis family transcriptional regulator [Cupriavidus basilensis]MDF3833467.1 sigma-54-dependent Fis family transcriptional regulator [Cupriavidus basilensis]